MPKVSTKANMFKLLLNKQKCNVCKNTPESTFLFRNLSKNTEFKQKFEKRYKEIINLYFHPERTISITDSIMSVYEVNMQDHINRWGYPPTINDWHDNVENNIKDFLRNRQGYTLKHLNQYMQN